MTLRVNSVIWRVAVANLPRVLGPESPRLFRRGSRAVHWGPRVMYCIVTAIAEPERLSMSKAKQQGSNQSPRRNLLQGSPSIHPLSLFTGAARIHTQSLKVCVQTAVLAPAAGALAYARAVLYWRVGLSVALGDAPINSPALGRIRQRTRHEQQCCRKQS